MPLDGLSVPHLFQFARYPHSEAPHYAHPHLDQLLHEEEAVGFNPNILLQLGLPSKTLSDSYEAAIKASSSPIHSFTLLPLSGDSVRLPTWVLDYWREIMRAVEYRRDRKKVLVWLRGISQLESMAEICNQVMAGLSFFPWNGGNCSVHDMMSILTDSWLSDFHIDHVLINISNQYCDHFGSEASGHHVFLPVMDLISIVEGYKYKQNSGRAADKRRQFLEVEDNIVLGHVDSVAGVLHLPNHWTSIVIKFKPPCILYGDSLGHSMPPTEASSFRRWIHHMLYQSGKEISEIDISIYPLATTNQQDFNSCGLFAFNAIEHHYLEHLPLLQPDICSLAYYQIKIALNLLQEDTVSVFLLKIPHKRLWLIIYGRLQAMITLTYLPSPTFPPLSLCNPFQTYFQSLLYSKQQLTPFPRSHSPVSRWRNPPSMTPQLLTTPILPITLHLFLNSLLKVCSTISLSVLTSTIHPLTCLHHLLSHQKLALQ